MKSLKTHINESILGPHNIVKAMCRHMVKVSRDLLYGRNASKIFARFPNDNSFKKFLDEIGIKYEIIKKGGIYSGSTIFHVAKTPIEHFGKQYTVENIILSHVNNDPGCIQIEFVNSFDLWTHGFYMHTSINYKDMHNARVPWPDRDKDPQKHRMYNITGMDKGEIERLADYLNLIKEHQ